MTLKNHAPGPDPAPPVLYKVDAKGNLYVWTGSAAAPHQQNPSRPGGARMTLTAEEKALLLELLRPRAQTLAQRLADQVRTLPVGDDSWAETAEELAITRGALSKLERPHG